MGKKETVTIEINVDGTREITQATKATAGLNKEVTKVSQSAATFDKNLKGAAGAAKGATSQFAKQSQGMGGLVHVYATVAANIFALSSAYLLLKRNADLTIMAKSARDLSISTGISYASVATSMKELTQGAISFTGAMRQANLAISGGATISQVKEITEIANKAANTLGVSVPDAVGRMIQAVTKGEPELVDELGIILRLTTASEKYAAQIGKTAETLTTFEKQQAIMMQLIEQGNAKFSNVQKRTNPYEKLSASVADLSVQLVSLISGPISALAEIFSGSKWLIGAGMALLVSYIGKKAVPEITKMGAVWVNSALEAEVAAKKATAAQKETVKVLKQRKQELTAIQQISNSGITKSLVTQTIMPKLPKTTKLSKGLNSAIDKLKGEEGNIGKALLKNLRASGVEQEINRLLSLDLNDGKTPKFVKGLLAKHRTSMQLLADQIKGTTKDITKAQQAQQAADKKRLAAMETQARVQIRSSYTSGISNIFGGTGARESVDRYNASVRALNSSFETARMHQTSYNKSLSKTSYLFKRVGLAGALAAKGIGLLANAIPWLAGLLFAFQAIKGVLQSIGILSAKFSKQGDAIAKVTKELADAGDKYKSIQKEIKTAPDSIEEVVRKWTKVANVTKQYSDQVLTAIENTRGVEDQNWLEEWWGGVNVSEAARIIGKGTQQIRDITKSTLAINIPIELDEKRKKEALKSIADIKKGMEYLNTRAGRSSKSFIEKETQKLKAFNDMLQNTVTITAGVTSDDYIKTILGSSGEIDAILTSFTRGFGDATREVNNFSVSAQEASDAILALDKVNSDIAKKSQSNRIFNVDTLMRSRAELVKLHTAVSLLGSETAILEADSSVVKVFDSLSTAVKNTYLSMINGSTSAKVATKALSSTIGEMGALINVIQNHSHEMSILAEKEKLARIERDKDTTSVANQVAVYNLATNKLIQQRKKINADIAATQKQETSLPKDIAKNKIRIRDLRAQAKTLTKIIDAKNEGIPIIAAEIAEQEKLKRIEKSRSELYNERNTLIKGSLTFVKQSSQTLYRVTALLKEQFILEKGLNQTQMEGVRNERERLDLAIQKQKLLTIVPNQEANILNKARLLSKERRLQLDLKYKELKLRQDEIKAENINRSQVGQHGLANSFAGLGDSKFWEAAGNNMGKIANDMAATTNSVATMTGILVGGIESVTGTLVDALIMREWDGKDEGRSMGVAIREALKDSLRQTIGDAIKDNMKQAALKMAQSLFGKEDEKIVLIRSQITQLQSNTGAIQALNATMSASAAGSSIPDIISLGANLIPNLAAAGGAAGGGGTIGNYGPITPAELGPITPIRGSRGVSSTAYLGSKGADIIPLPSNNEAPLAVSNDASGSNININQSFDFRGADSSTEAKLRQYAERIKQETKKEMIDDINRGGSMAKAVRRR